MRSPRYTILIANRKTGAVRRLTVAAPPLLVAGAATVLRGARLVLLAGIGAGRADPRELEALAARQREPAGRERELPRGDRRAGRPDFVAADGADAAGRAGASSTRRRARRIEKLPARRFARGRWAAARCRRPSRRRPQPSTPEGTFGVLQDLLGVLEDRLASVKTKVESQQALARATPSIWPVAGWLSSRLRHRARIRSRASRTSTPVSTSRPTAARRCARPPTAPSSRPATTATTATAIVVDHGFGIAHAVRPSLAASPSRAGQKVKRGEVIGYVGATGRATSPHLHYEILLNGKPINPLQPARASRKLARDWLGRAALRRRRVAQG